MTEISLTNRWALTVQKPRRKMVRNSETQAAEYVDDGHDVADIEIIVNVEEIARLLGRRAMTSAHKTSKALFGAVTVKASNIRRKA